MRIVDMEVLYKELDENYSPKNRGERREKRECGMQVLFAPLKEK